LSRALKSGGRAVTATVIETKGSTPRKTGSKMVVTSDGACAGTIGGGCAENQVFSLGRELMEHGRAVVLDVNLSLSPDSGSEMICGGRMRILADPWSEADGALAERIAGELVARRSCVLVTAVRGEAVGRGLVAENRALDDGLKALEIPGLDPRVEEAFGSGRPSVTETPGEILVVEPLEPSLSLVLAGAGHIAQPLGVFGKMLGFHVTVLDDRDVFANPMRFPRADRIIVGPFEESLRTLPLDRRTYVVLLTRGHDYDEECLRAVLGSGAAYIGMIGSRRRVRVVVDRLKGQGFAPELFERLHAPVGLDLGAETPAEIALCIAAEIEHVLKGGTGCPLSRKKPPSQGESPGKETIHAG